MTDVVTFATHFLVGSPAHLQKCPAFVLDDCCANRSGSHRGSHPFRSRPRPCAEKKVFTVTVVTAGRRAESKICVRILITPGAHGEVVQLARIPVVIRKPFHVYDETYLACDNAMESRIIRGARYDTIHYDPGVLAACEV